MNLLMLIAGATFLGIACLLSQLDGPLRYEAGIFVAFGVYGTVRSLHWAIEDQEKAR